MRPNPPGQSYNRRHDEKRHFRMAAIEPAGCAVALAVEAGFVPRAVDRGVMERPTVFVGAPPPPNDMANPIFF